MKKSENIILFEEALNKDKAKQKVYETALKRIAKEKSAKSNGELISLAAKEAGFDLTEQECERALAEKQEMSDDELEEVSGAGCWINNRCHYIVKHPKDIDVNSDCFTQYNCIMLSNQP